VVHLLGGYRLKKGWETTTGVSYVVRVVLPVLPKWPASPEYVAVMVTVIDLPGFVKETEQLAVGPVPLRVQLGGTNALFLLVLLLVQVTLSVGVSGKPRDVSDMEAVHVNLPEWPAQLTLLDVERFVTARLKLPLVAKWVESAL